MFGASPRASIGEPDPHKRCAPMSAGAIVVPAAGRTRYGAETYRHRLVLWSEALWDNVTSDMLLQKILDRIPIPVVPLHEHTSIRVNA